MSDAETKPARPASQFDFLDLVLPSLADRARSAERLERSHPHAAALECRYVIDQLLSLLDSRATKLKEDPEVPPPSFQSLAREAVEAEATPGARPRPGSLQANPHHQLQRGKREGWLDAQLVGRLRGAREVGNTAGHKLTPIRRHRLRSALAHTWELAAVIGRELTTDLPSSFDPKRQDELARADAGVSPGELAEQQRADVLAKIDQLLRDGTDPGAANQAALDLIASLAPTPTNSQQARLNGALAAAWDNPKPHDFSAAPTADWIIRDLLSEARWQYDAPDLDVRIDHVLLDDAAAPVAILETTHSRRGLPAGLAYADRIADEIEARFGRRPIIYASTGFEHERAIPGMAGEVIDELDDLNEVMRLLADAPAR